MPATARKSAVQTTTVRLPRHLYEEARRALEKGETNASSLNELLIQSLEERLQRARRELIDGEFVHMKNDERYQRESAVLARHFASNDRETLRSAERDKQS
jgi:Arc/MetJ-type ribon-helix-helix transcriptional regulator